MGECKKIVEFIKNNYTFISATLFFLFAIMGFFYDVAFYTRFHIDIISLSSPEDFIFSWVKSGSVILYITKIAIILLSYQITYCYYSSKQIKTIDKFFYIILFFSILIILIRLLSNYYLGFIFKHIDYSKILLEFALKFNEFFTDFDFFLVFIYSFISQNILTGFIIAILRIKFFYDDKSFIFILIPIFLMIFITNFYLFVQNDTENIGKIKDGFYEIKKVDSNNSTISKYMLIGANSQYYMFFEIIDDEYYDIKIKKATIESYYSKQKGMAPKVVIIHKDEVSEMIFHPFIQ